MSERFEELVAVTLIREEFKKEPMYKSFMRVIKSYNSDFQRIDRIGKRIRPKGSSPLNFSGHQEKLYVHDYSFNFYSKEVEDFLYEKDYGLNDICKEGGFFECKYQEIIPIINTRTTNQFEFSMPVDCPQLLHIDYPLNKEEKEWMVKFNKLYEVLWLIIFDSECAFFGTYDDLKDYQLDKVKQRLPIIREFRKAMKEKDGNEFYDWYKKFKSFLDDAYIVKNILLKVFDEYNNVDFWKNQEFNKYTLDIDNTNFLYERTEKSE